jgi:hypothetical protein
LRLRKIPALGPAERYFLALLAAPPGASPAPPERLPSGFSRRILELASEHNLRGHLYARLRREVIWDALPPAVQYGLRQGHIQHAFRNTLFRKELLRILDGLAAAGIEPVLLKGAALSLTVCPDPGERPSADIDLLLAPTELDRAAAVMRDRGFVLDERRQSETFYRDFHFHLIFHHPERTWCRFELHWALSLPLMDTDLDALEVMKRTRVVSLEGRRTRLPAPEDLLLHLCQHTSLSAFSILAQLRDVHAVVTHTGWDLDPESFWRGARRDRLATIAAACLELAGWFGEKPNLVRLREQGPPLPEDLRRLLRPETVLRRHLLQSSAGLRAVSLMRRDRLADRWSFLGRLIRPSGVDLELNGHAVSAARLTARRSFSRQGAGLAVRALVYLMLARIGWEVEPGPSPPAATATRREPEAP